MRGLDVVEGPRPVGVPEIWHARWAAAGLPVSQLRAEQWGMVEFSVTDPSGNRLRVGRADDSGPEQRCDTRTISTEDPVAVAVVTAIRSGDLTALRQLLDEHPWLATARLGDDDPDGMSRTLLHVVTDWPGHYPKGVQTVAVLVAAGADVNARFHGPHEETPLHWAASNDDVAVLDALLDVGADIEAPGAVLGGGSPIADARGFKQWNVAARLVERGAATTLVDAATIGLTDRVGVHLTAPTPPGRDEVNHAFWGACHGGRLPGAKLLLAHGAELNWVPPWENLTPLDAAERDQATDLVHWLREQGAERAGELTGEKSRIGW